MVGIFSQRGFVLFWVIVIALGAQSNFVLELTKNIRESDVQTYLTDGLTWLDSIAPQIINYLWASLNINASINSSAGSFQLTPAIILALFAPIPFLITLYILRNAIKSKSFFDDYVALGVFYIAIQVMSGLWVQVGVLQAQWRENFIAGLMTVVVIFLNARAGALHESKIFFRELLQVFVIWAFILPGTTVGMILDGLDKFALYCQSLWPNPTPVMKVVAAIAGIFAIGQIYGIGTKPRRPPGPILDALKVKIAEDVEAAKKLLDQ